MNFFQLGVTGFVLVNDAFKQSAFIKSFLKPLVNKHCSRLGYQLSNTERKKVLFYYPMYTVLACAQMYMKLKGRKLTYEETRRLTLVGSMATLCDDLIDENNWTRDQVFHLLSTNLNEDGLIIKAKLLVALNKELQQFWPLTEVYVKQLRVALEWQSTSAKQLDANITFDEVVQVCREKNGHTSLMFATLIDEDWSEQELQFIYQSAIVGQLTNDSFDVYVDSQAGINTFISKASSINTARAFFISECKKLHQCVLDCEVALKFKKACIRRMSCMHAYALVAFDNLERVENKYGLPMDWKKPERKEAVTDMAFIKNQFRLMKYIVRLSKI